MILKALGDRELILRLAAEEYDLFKVCTNLDSDSCKDLIWHIKFFFITIGLPFLFQYC